MRISWEWGSGSQLESSAENYIIRGFTNIYSGKNFIELSKIEINLDLIKFLKNENSIKKVEISSKANSIKNLTDFINSYKFNLPRFIIFNQIEKGSVQITANIYFDQENIANQF